MKMSKMFMPTLREVPADAEITSHQLMLRAGMIRKMASGVYNQLPMGIRVFNKIQEIIREELNKMEQDMIGAEKWIELIKEYSVPKELTAQLLNAMIEKILIHSAETNENGERIQEIEIYYRFIGKVE